MFKILLITLALSCSLMHASVLGFVNNPTSNSTDWTTSVTGLGGSINTNVNFNSHPLGALVPGFYTVSDGVTLTPTGDVNSVTFGTGPGQGNTTSPPLSTGEGSHAASTFLLNNGNASTLDITFTSPVLGAGLFIIDYFNPDNTNRLRIEAFTGPNGTGTSVGLSSVAFNFQPNNTYFMGISSSANNIRSLIFTDVNAIPGDITGIDDIRFATGDAAPPIPEPSTWLMLAGGLAGLAGFRRRSVSRIN